MRTKVPSEARLRAVERELRDLPRGAQRSVGQGIYMRLDGHGRRRFQFRIRHGGSHSGGTSETFEGALADRDELERLNGVGLDGLADIQSLRKMKLHRFARERWWTEHVLLHLDPTTQSDYEQDLRLALEVAGDYTLEQLERGGKRIVDEIKKKVKRAKTFPSDDPKRPGEFASAAADHVLKLLRAICTHAFEQEIIERNPFVGIKLFHRKRGPTGVKSGGHRRIAKKEVKHPRVIAQVGLGMRGSIADIEVGRSIPELIAYGGLRPQVICAMRHRNWRDENGPLPYIEIYEAIKDIRGHLIVGEPKTGAQEPTLWPALAEQLERVFQEQGCPDLDALFAPNARGGYLDWGNWRRVWYAALCRAGITTSPTATAARAFDPYRSRHSGAVAMLHAERPPELGGGTYSRYEVARHFGHTVTTLDKVYADIPKEHLGIAGLTMDEIIRGARREAWGPIPGDPDYEEILYTTDEVAALTGISRQSVTARIQRRHLAATRRVGQRYLVSDHDLVLVGLLPPRHRR